MANIIIIGAGSISSAFSLPCSENNNQTVIIGSNYDDDLIDQINNNNNYHPVLDSKLSSNIKFIKYKNILDERYDTPDLIVIGTNSKGIEWSGEVLEKICKDKKLPPLLLLTKGLNVYNNKFELLIEKLNRILSYKNFTNINISAIAGPCLAGELAMKKHSSVVITNENLKTAQWLSNLLSTEYYHTFLSDDVNGVEICAAIKNIFSIAIGSAKGLNNNKNYLNTSAALFTQSVFEMELFVTMLKGKKETVKGLAGIGDLHVSAAGGRNSMLGSYLGAGLLYSEVKQNEMKDITVEGAELSFEIFELVKNTFNVEKIPLMFSTMESIVENKQMEINWEYFK